MRKQHIEAETIEQAQEYAPWACVITEVEGGYLAFESADDASIWEAQE